MLSCARIALSIFAAILTFDFGHNGENIAAEMHGAALVFGIWEYFARGLQHSHALVTDEELHAVQTAATQPLEEAADALNGMDLSEGRPRPRSRWKKPTQLALSSFIPSAAPRTSRNPSSFTAVAAGMATFSYSPPQLRRRQMPST